MPNYKPDSITLVQCGRILKSIPSTYKVLELHKKVALGTGVGTFNQIDDNENPYQVPTGKIFHMLACRFNMANGTATCSIYDSVTINTADTIKVVISLSANLYTDNSFAIIEEASSQSVAGKYITFQASAAFIREAWLTGYETPA